MKELSQQTTWSEPQKFTMCAAMRGSGIICPRQGDLHGQCGTTGIYDEDTKLLKTNKLPENHQAVGCPIAERHIRTYLSSFNQGGEVIFLTSKDGTQLKGEMMGDSMTLNNGIIETEY